MFSKIIIGLKNISKILYLRIGYRSRSILAAENIAKDGNAPTTNGQIKEFI